MFQQSQPLPVDFFRRPVSAKNGLGSETQVDLRTKSCTRPTAMIKVALDTNILHQEGLYSRNMQYLARLASSGGLKVFVPDMVRREFLTKKLVDAHEKFDVAKSGLIDVAKGLDRQGRVNGMLSKIQEQLNEVRSHMKTTLEAEFEAWCVSSHVSILNFDNASLPAVIDDYFNGTGPYRKIKSREDIPDAIISSCICALTETSDRVFVVLKDGYLRRHLANLPKITVSENLSDFFKIEDVARLVNEIDAKIKNVEELKNYFSSILFQDELSQYLFGSGEHLDEVYLQEDAIEGTSRLEAYDYGASINEPEFSEVHNVDFADVAFIDAGHMSIKVAFTTACRIDYCASYASYIGLPLETRDKIKERSVSGHGIADLSENREVRLQGYVDLLFPKHSTLDELKVHSQYLADGSSRIKVELNVEHAIIG
ncbi:PIN domain-containing protein [Paraburkholderia sp. SIMBA_054]|uniref:PIN domain-containing protein n=1 Tax=Paraburkholderia sp. SIMBA_054 TaxID=3085795 RepID=UPI00397B7FE9